MRDLQCEPNTFVGPVDPNVVEKIEERYPVDPDYLECLQTCHGAETKIGLVKVGAKHYRVARFLTLFDRKSDLPPPFRPHFDSELDERVMESVRFLMDFEHQTSRALFTDLVPFASTRNGMCLDRAEVDLFCFDYRGKSAKTPVVLWDAYEAKHAYITWDRLPLDESFDTDGNFLAVPWDDFVIPVAPSFAGFLEMLQPVKPE